MQTGLNVPLQGWRPMPGSLFNRSCRDFLARPNSADIVSWWASATDSIRVDSAVPYTVVPNKQAMVKVTIAGTDSCPWPTSNVQYAPIPANFTYQLDSDSHAVLLQLDAFGNPCQLYEFWYPSKLVDGSWQAKVAVQWNPLAGDLQRTVYVSANVYGGAIMPYLITKDDCLDGMRHAAGFTLPSAQFNHGFVTPATFSGFQSTDPRSVAMGTRIRLRASFDSSQLPMAAASVARGLQTYGAIAIDAGSMLHFTATPDTSQYSAQFQALHQALKPTDFEVLA